MSDISDDLEITLVKECDALRAEVERLRAALEFYADPCSYHAIAFLGDRPCGGFIDDLSEDEWTKAEGYQRLMPGKAARAALEQKADTE